MVDVDSIVFQVCLVTLYICGVEIVIYLAVYALRKLLGIVKGMLTKRKLDE